MTRVFGARRPGVRYERRPAAYAVIRGEQGRVALVRSGDGLFLPGGGRHAGESARETLRREVREECGRAVTIHAEIGEAIQHFESAAGPLALHGVYFEASFVGEPIGPGEHELLWVAPREAETFHECHAWAIRRSRRSAPEAATE